MNRRLISILLIIFVALAVFVATQPEQSATNLTSATTTANWREGFIFPDVTVLDIVTVNLRDPNNGTTFTISRAADGTWTAPSSTGILDTEAASLIAQSIVLLPFEQYLDSPDLELSEYGFNPNGILFIEFILNDETQHIIAVGGLSTTRQNYYVVVDDRPGVYVSGRGPLDFLIKSLLSPPLT